MLVFFVTNLNLTATNIRLFKRRNSMGLWDLICAFDGIIAKSTIENYESLERKSRCGRITAEEAEKLQQYRDLGSYDKSRQILDYVNGRKNRDR